MAYKDILVHMGGAGIEARSKLAVMLCEAGDAHLIGLHVIQPPDVPAYIEAQLTSEMLKAQERFAQQDREKCQAVFHAAVKGASFSTECRTVQGDAVEALQLHGRHVDLVVIGQTDPSAPAAVNLDIAGRVTLSLGRPVLVVPYAGTFATIGKRVLVAWDGSRTAARALGDAIPLLKEAKAVCVMSLNPEKDHAAMAGVDIATHLARHGINVEAQHLQAADVDVGAALLARAADFGADMLVMGAYGHARWRQLVLGGVTEFMLDHMTIPVLMSH